MNSGKTHIGLIIVFIVVVLLGIVLLSDDPEDEIIENSSDEKYTLMVFLCGSDLESDGGYASDDIDEMLESSLADEVNLLIYTGGATEWSNENISADRNQIFKVENKEIKLVNDDIGMKYFSKPDTLLEFLNWSKDNYKRITWKK